MPPLVIHDSTPDPACLDFVCPTTGLRFHDANALVQTLAGVTFVQARCPHCDGCNRPRGHADFEEAWPQVHACTLESMPYA